MKRTTNIPLFFAFLASLFVIGFWLIQGNNLLPAKHLRIVQPGNEISKDSAQPEIEFKKVQINSDTLYIEPTHPPCGPGSIFFTSLPAKCISPEGELVPVIGFTGGIIQISEQLP